MKKKITWAEAIDITDKIFEETEKKISIAFSKTTEDTNGFYGNWPRKYLNILRGHMDNLWRELHKTRKRLRNYEANERRGRE